MDSRQRAVPHPPLSKREATTRRLGRCALGLGDEGGLSVLLLFFISLGCFSPAPAPALRVWASMLSTSPRPIVWNSCVLSSPAPAPPRTLLRRRSTRLPGRMPAARISSSVGPNRLQPISRRRLMPPPPPFTSRRLSSFHCRTASASDPAGAWIGAAPLSASTSVPTSRPSASTPRLTLRDDTPPLSSSSSLPAATSPTPATSAGSVSPRL